VKHIWIDRSTNTKYYLVWKSGATPDFDSDADAARIMSTGPQYVAAGLAIESDNARKLIEGKDSVVPPRAPGEALSRDVRLARTAPRGVIPAGARATNAAGEAALRAASAPALGGSVDPDTDFEDLPNDESGPESDGDDDGGGGVRQVRLLRYPRKEGDE
jgi:hypothetical protein